MARCLLVHHDTSDIRDQPRPERFEVDETEDGLEAITLVNLADPPSDRGVDHAPAAPHRLQPPHDRAIGWRLRLASLSMLSSGAASLDPALQRAFEDRYGIPVLLSDGATEFGGPAAMMTAPLAAEYGRAKLGTVGRAMAAAGLRVVHPATGAVLEAGEQRLLEVALPRIGPDWIRTPDIAVIDADGFLFIRGRANGAIIRGGFNLVPEAIERALLLHPAVGAVAVVGVAEARLGQVPGAAIQLKPDAIATPGRGGGASAPALWAFFDDLPKIRR